MPNTPRRDNDYQIIADTAANKEAIANIKEDIAEVRDDVHEVSTKLDEHIKSTDAKLDKVIAGIAAQRNQFLGAGRLVKFIYLALPALAAAFAWWARGKA